MTDLAPETTREHDDTLVHARDTDHPSHGSELPEGYSVEVSHLSAEGQQQVHEALQDTADSHGHVSAEEANAALDAAKSADDHRENVEAAHQHQADAADRGDYAHANEAAHTAEYEAHAVQDAGGDAGHQVVQSEHDQQALDSAQGHQQSAHDEAVAAQHQAEAHNADAAHAAAEHAADDAAAARHDGHSANQGGHGGDHSYDSADSTGETHSE